MGVLFCWCGWERRLNCEGVKRYPWPSDSLRLRGTLPPDLSLWTRLSEFPAYHKYLIDLYWFFNFDWWKLLRLVTTLNNIRDFFCKRERQERQMTDENFLCEERERASKRLNIQDNVFFPLRT